MATITPAIGSGKPLRSASAIVAGTESGQHLLKIAGYSRTKDVPTRSYIRSRSFHVGGHSWHILYYPNGLTSSWSDYVSIYLQLDYNVHKGVRAQYRFDLLDHRGKPVPHHTLSSEQIFRDVGWGTAAFIKREELEKSEHLRDDCFTIRCEFTVMKEVHTEDIEVVDGATPSLAVVVPPSDLHRHLGNVLATGRGADVTFEVDGKTFPAHRLVLAARSPVLLDALSGQQQKQAKEGTDGAAAEVVRIEDMEAPDFEAFLHYVYTDTLPEMKGDGAAAMLPDLVAAANRYKMERLRLVCEDKLCDFVNTKTAAAMLAFAGEHHCHGLKEACLRFLQDPGNLREVVKINCLQYLTETCPSVLKDLIAKVVASDAW
jgi:speckle-type POZ protein